MSLFVCLNIAIPFLRKHLVLDSLDWNRLKLWPAFLNSISFLSFSKLLSKCTQMGSFLFWLDFVQTCPNIHTVTLENLFTLLKIRVPKRGFHSNAISGSPENLLVKSSKKNVFFSVQRMFKSEETFFQWKGSMDVKGSSWNHRWQKKPLF